MTTPPRVVELLLAQALPSAKTCDRDTVIESTSQRDLYRVCEGMAWISRSMGDNESHTVGTYTAGDVFALGSAPVHETMTTVLPMILYHYPAARLEEAPAPLYYRAMCAIEQARSEDAIRYAWWLRHSLPVRMELALAWMRDRMGERIEPAPTYEFLADWLAGGSARVSQCLGSLRQSGKIRSNRGSDLWLSEELGRVEERDGKLPPVPRIA